MCVLGIQESLLLYIIGTGALACLWVKLAKRRFYCFFDGKYRYGKLNRLSTPLSTNKELIWKKN